jgi:hypothetical protein
MGTFRPYPLNGKRMNNIYLPGTVTIPSSLVITAITQAFPMVVTCIVNSVTESNTYLPGMLVRLFVPSAYGMYQANGLTGKILEVNGLDFTLNLDSNSFSPFVIPSSGNPQPASMAPAGSQNLQYSNSTNIVPFQSLNDMGN